MVEGLLSLPKALGSFYSICLCLSLSLSSSLGPSLSSLGPFLPLSLTNQNTVG